MSTPRPLDRPSVADRVRAERILREGGAAPRVGPIYLTSEEGATGATEPWEVEMPAAGARGLPESLEDPRLAPAGGWAMPTLEADADVRAFEEQVQMAVSEVAKQRGALPVILRIHLMEPRSDGVTHRFTITSARMSKAFADLHPSLHMSRDGATMGTLRRYLHNPTYELFKIEGDGTVDQWRGRIAEARRSRYEHVAGCKCRTCAFSDGLLR
jgi:hypothetical protein